MQSPVLETDSIKPVLDSVIAQVCEVILGKQHQVRLAIACVLAQGHLLIEDIPGVGKTTLAHALAKTLGLQYSRIQFTSDLLPADILGASIFDRESGDFKFHPGPIFAQLILADEINRATPKAQSALLEAMEEEQVSLEGKTRNLPTPFFVIATQNPSYQIGTFPLPESQLDRFLMQIQLGYPDAKAERALLTGQSRRDLVHNLKPCLSLDDLVDLQSNVVNQHTSEPFLNYLQALLDFSRRSPDIAMGLSPRAGIALLRSAQAWALLEGRNHVLPEDLQTILPYVVIHRLRPVNETSSDGPVKIVEQLLNVPIP